MAQRGGGIPRPSGIPSGRPSGIRPPSGSSVSGRPSFGPSGRPSMGPPGRPSLGPSGRPSLGPSGRPSLDPSGRPPMGPSGRPGLGPRGKTSLGLTGRPSLGLGKGPMSSTRLDEGPKYQKSRTSLTTSMTSVKKKKPMPQQVPIASVVLNPEKEKPAVKPPTASRIEVKSKRVEVKKEKKPQPDLIPALSIFQKGPKKPVYDKEALKNQMFRRQSPEGEDIKQLREILKGLKGQSITVQEFIGLVSPYTADNGEILRRVFADDVNSFRNMAKRIYDTMTQDVSDVLTNEHVHLMDSQKEKYEIYTFKMMKAIDEIFELCPDFDFEKYYQNPTEYLQAKFPEAKVVVLDPEEEEMQLRHEAYHRLQWLRSEGERLTQENERLQMRLKQLKAEQRDQVKKAEEVEAEAEETKAQLEEAEATLQEKLENLNQSIDRSMVVEEVSIREKIDTSSAVTESVSKSRVRKDMPTKREGWNKKAANEIEAEATVTTMSAEVSKVTLKSTASRPKIIKKKMVKGKGKVKGGFHYSPIKTPPRSDSSAPKEKSPFHFSPIKSPPRPPPPKERSPFHYSPVRSPPRPAPPKEKSPFHYSPIRSPPKPAAARPRSPFHFSPPKTPPGYYQEQQPLPQPQKSPPIRTTRVEKTTVSTEKIPIIPSRRKASAPRDSWGGFY